MRKPAAASSLAIHAIVALALFTITFRPGPKGINEAARRVIPLIAPREPRKNDGGGGQRQPLPASRGRLPEHAAHRVWTPPMVPLNSNPRLAVQSALIEAPEFNIEASETGDPLGRAGIPSGGAGGPFGIGDGHGVAVGPGPGGGPAGHERAATTARISRLPQVLQMVEPEYSEEARKARFQGIVVLAIDVDTNGRATNIRVVRGLGLGLDERAITAVEKWRFSPALAGGQPVRCPATVEVGFHLL
jgi:periplasmic protein TonB